MPATEKILHLVEEFKDKVPKSRQLAQDTIEFCEVLRGVLAGNRIDEELDAEVNQLKEKKEVNRLEEENAELEETIQRLEKKETDAEDEVNRLKEKNAELEETIQEKDLHLSAIVRAIQDVLDSEPDSRLRERFENLVELLRRDDLVFEEAWQITSRL